MWLYGHVKKGKILENGQQHKKTVILWHFQDPVIQFSYAHKQANMFPDRERKQKDYYPPHCHPHTGVLKPH